ncbi:MAG: glycoside hydrolase family 88 protein [Lentisphaeria bacterium]|nr:glycoside hydrolase family 88 protein [Lentisphaeria bacterium]
MNYALTAFKMWDRYLRQDFPPAYTTVLTCYAALRLAEVTNDEALLGEVLEKIRPYWNGDVPSVSGYYGKYDYSWGGNASAWALRRGYLPEAAAEKLCTACDGLLHRQPRSADGTFCQPTWYDSSNWSYCWIDTVFGVCPFLLWTGLSCSRPEYVDEAAAQMRKHHELLFDLERGLYHQAINGRRPGKTPGFWSRGVGWGLHALVDLAADLPAEHPEYGFIRKAFSDVLAGCLAAQDEEGMWHQSMDDFGTYPETSGTGLILYALGKGIRTGLLPEEKYLDAFRKGFRGLAGYLALDGSVHNCCSGCCCPGYNGTVADYQQRAWVMNDHHAFGSPILACTEAVELLKLGLPDDDEA